MFSKVFLDLSFMMLELRTHMFDLVYVTMYVMTCNIYGRFTRIITNSTVLGPGRVILW